MNINTNGENNRATRFDSHSLGDPTSDSDTSVEDYFMKRNKAMRELEFRRKKGELN